MLVAVGGAAGALARAASTGAGDAWSVAAVNVAGCLLMGVLTAWLAAPGRWPGWSPLLSTGVLGGFTTFSAWAVLEADAPAAAHITLLACPAAYVVAKRLARAAGGAGRTGAAR